MRRYLVALIIFVSSTAIASCSTSELTRGIGTPETDLASIIGKKPSARIALVIGNSQYKSAPPLANTESDARDIGAALRRLGFQVNLLLNADLRELQQGLSNFQKDSLNSSISLVFFAGHGMEISGKNWIIPTDAQLDRDVDAPLETVELTILLDSVSHARDLGLVVLDACRNNPFISRMVRTGGSSRSIYRGLRGIEPPQNTLVAYAAKEGTVALDGDGDSNSPFTTALLQHIETPDVEVAYLFRLVRDAVVDRTGGKQIPHTYGTLGKKKIYLGGIARDERKTTKIEEGNASTPNQSQLGDEIDTLVQTAKLPANNRQRHTKIDPRFSERPAVVLEGHDGNISQVWESFDGKHLVSIADDGVRIWDAATGRQNEHIEGINHVDVSESKNLLIYSKCMSAVWNECVSSTVFIRPLVGQRSAAKVSSLDERVSLSLLADGARILATGKISKRIIDIKSGDVKHTLKGQEPGFLDQMHPFWITAHGSSPNNAFVATGTYNGVVSIWNSDTGELVHRTASKGSLIRVLKFSPNGKLIASGGEDGAVRLWEARSGWLVRTLENPSRSVRAVDFDPSGRFIVAGFYDGAIKLWSLDDFEEKQEFRAFSRSVLSLRFSRSDGLLIAGGCERVRDHKCDRALVKVWGPPDVR